MIDNQNKEANKQWGIDTLAALEARFGEKTAEVLLSTFVDAFVMERKMKNLLGDYASEVSTRVALLAAQFFYNYTKEGQELVQEELTEAKLIIIDSLLKDNI